MDDIRLIVGSFAQGQGPGMWTLGLDRSNGALGRLDSVEPSPSSCLFVRPDPQRRWLLATDQVKACDGVPGGALHSYALDHANRGLRWISRQPTHGGTPCYVDVHRSGRWAVVGHHGGGSISVLPIDEQGRLGKPTQVLEHETSSTGQQPRVHCCLFDPSHQYVLAADRGIDQVIVYRFDDVAGRLEHAHTLDIDADEDPRHLAFSPNGRFVYCITEVGNHVLVLEWDESSGSLKQLDSKSTLPPGYNEQTFAADLHVHPSGKFLYGSNRGHESIAIFALDEDGAALRPLGHEPTRGKFPRGFTIDPDGRWLIVGNEHSDRLDVFEIDQQTGLLTHTGEPTDLAKPAGMGLV